MVFVHIGSRGVSSMPRPHVVIRMSIEAFGRLEHRLGWKHEYWDGAARLSPQETAVVAFQRPAGGPTAFGQILPKSWSLRAVRADDERALADLFIEAFDDAVEYVGWPDDTYQLNARDILASFFGKPTRRAHHDRPPGRPEVSYACVFGEQVLGAALIRSIRQGPVLEPIMVHPTHQRQGLATVLLSASLAALSQRGVTTLYSRCHLGNAAGLAWHEKNGFQEIPNYFAATHRWRHYAGLAEHFEDAGQPDRASDMRKLAQQWEAILQQFEQSKDRWSSGLL
jgi:GNAT superfamily N-acetyltransferase